LQPNPARNCPNPIILTESAKANIITPNTKHPHEDLIANFLPKLSEMYGKKKKPINDPT
jgi:hypothetical protein